MVAVVDSTVTRVEETELAVAAETATETEEAADLLKTKKLIRKQFRKKYAKHRPSWPEQVVAEKA